MLANDVRRSHPVFPSTSSSSSIKPSLVPAIGVKAHLPLIRNLIMTVKMDEQKEPARPVFYRFRSSPNFILLTVCVGVFNDVFLFGAIIPVLPYALPHRIHVGYESVQIYIAVLLAVYGGALLVGSLVFGWVGDRLPRRHALFLLGLVMLLGSTAILSFGRHIALLVIGRLLQGLSAALVWTSGLAFLTDIFGQERYGEAIGYTQTSVGVGTTSAPLLGGLAYARGGYRAVSMMSIGTVAFSIVLAVIMVEPEAPSRREESGSKPSVTGKIHQDPACEEVNGTIRNANGHSTLEPASEFPDERSPLIERKPKDDSSPYRSAYPLLLRSGRVLAAMGGIATYAFVIISFEGLVPLFVKETFHWNSMRAALMFLAWIIPSFLGPVAGKLSDRLGPRWVAIGGFTFAAPPLVLMRFVTNNSTSHKVLLCGLLTMVGLGLVCTVPACITDLTAAATDLKQKNPRQFGDSGASGQSFGLFVFAYSCGSVVGPPIVSVIKEQVSWGSATLSLACVSAAAAVFIMIKTPARLRRKHRGLR